MASPSPKSDAQIAGYCRLLFEKGTPSAEEEGIWNAPHGERKLLT